VTDGENEGDDCDEVICVGWGEPGGEWTQWGWRNEEGSWVIILSLIKRLTIRNHTTDTVHEMVRLIDIFITQSNIKTAGISLGVKE